MALAIEYFPTSEGVSHVLWRGRWPMRGDKFPADHPVGGSFCGVDKTQCGVSDQMTAFRNLGYWASCFPEGDGMCLLPPEGRDAMAVARDIRDTFGWAVRVKKG